MRKKRILFGALILLGILALFAAALPFFSSTPQAPSSPSPEPSPDPYSNEYAQLDVSSLDEGVIQVRYIGGAPVRVKVQITKSGGTDYNYDLSADESWESYALTEGDGDYVLQVLEHQQENRYRPVFSCPLTLALADPAAPFRRSNQFVCFDRDSLAASLAAELTEGLETEGEKVETIFRYVTESLTYDSDRSATVEAGYLPDVDDVLTRGKGICFDYAAVMAAMLRSQGVACKLAVGYAGKEYHAWVEVPDGKGGWALKDPTFVSANRDDPKVMAFVSTPENYKARFYY